MKIKLILILITIFICLLFFYIKYHKTSNKQTQKINQKILNLDDYNKKICICILGKHKNLKQIIMNIVDKAKSPLRLHFFIVSNNVDIIDNIEMDIFQSSGLNVNITCFKNSSINYKTTYNIFKKKINATAFSVVCFIQPKYIYLKKNFDILFFIHSSQNDRVLFTGNSNSYYCISQREIPIFISKKLIFDKQEQVPLLAMNPFLFFMTANTFKELPIMLYSVPTNILQLFMTQLLFQHNFHFYSNRINFQNAYISNDSTEEIINALMELKKKNFKLNKDVMAGIGILLNKDKLLITSNARAGVFNQENEHSIIVKHGSILQYRRIIDDNY